MSVLTREQLNEALKKIVGENPTDESLSMLEDFTDTFNHYDGLIGEDWKKKFEENDTAWRNKYTARFFEGTPTKDEPILPPKEKEEPPVLTFDNLFEKKEG